jgi:hypothetical protein
MTSKSTSAFRSASTAALISDALVTSLQVAPGMSAASRLIASLRLRIRPLRGLKIKPTRAAPDCNFSILDFN